jgi:hypothetical protein
VNPDNQKEANKFLLAALAIGTVFMAALLLLQFKFQKPVPKVLDFFIPVYTTLNIFLHRALVKANERSPRMFVLYFMVTVTVKLLAIAGFLLACAYFFKDQKFTIALAVGLCYITFTWLLVRSLIRLVKNRPTA